MDLHLRVSPMGDKSLKPAHVGSTKVELMSVRWIVTLVVLLLCVSIPASGASSAAGDAAVPIPEVDVIGVAEEFGVSREVARARLEFEAEFIVAVSSIASRVPSYVDSALSSEFAARSGTVLLAGATPAEWELAEVLLEPLGDARRDQSSPPYCGRRGGDARFRSEPFGLA